MLNSKNIYLKFNLLIISVITVTLLFISCGRTTPRILVFSKTAGFRHESIEAGKQALSGFADKYRILVDTTENSSAFLEDNLKKYNVVIFLNTTGDVLNPEEQNAFERWIQAGGAWVGIHAATDTEFDWLWYGRLAGAYFKDHPNNPNVQEGEFHVLDRKHPACNSLPDHFRFTDEFYNFVQVSESIKPLIVVDEKSYKGGKMGDWHPMAWYCEFDGGRSFYTALGHTAEAFSDPLFLRHLWGGIKWALNDGRPKALDYSKARSSKMP